MVFSSKKNFDSQCCWKQYSDFGGGKKKSDSEFLSYNLMLNSVVEKWKNVNRVLLLALTIETKITSQESDVIKNTFITKNWTWTS